ncbi:hypothetical protein RJ639_013973 [Escallonia herrerae]|uniref:BZIP domain-containing protein n=1 Tax=Escallonia herrerae TaxID=1293975 RepID=A0AA89APX1_9ASTE|nr:hypothetical protein RJ639_013973 [Escallonia herrerae]
MPMQAFGVEDDERYTTMDEKKRRRMISNLESARRSRMKREQHTKDLNDQVMLFMNDRKEIIQKINEVGQRYGAIEAENRILRAQREDLSKRLESAEIVASYVVGTSTYGVDVPQDPWFRPWQPPLQSPPITTSAGFLQF